MGKFYKRNNFLLSISDERIFLDIRNLDFSDNMWTIAGFLLLFLANQCYSESSYTTKYDGVNLDEILNSDRILNGYVNCLLDKGPCTPDGKELKNNLPDAIDNDCKKCTEKQREGSEKVMHYIIDNRPEDWEKLEEKYDTDGSYKLKYLATKLNKEGNEDIEKKEPKSEEDSENSNEAEHVEGPTEKKNK